MHLSRTLLIMNFTAIFLFAVALHAGAHGYSQNISLSLRDAPLEKVFAELERQTDYSFVANQVRLQEGKKVTIKVQNAAIEDVLEQCFREQPFTYTISNKIVIVKEKDIPKEGPPIASMPPIEVRGIIKDANGAPLNGVSVTVKGTNRGTTSREDGSFLINANEGEELVVSMVGYGVYTVKVNARTGVLNISLSPELSSLSDVVVVGYGTMHRGDITGAISKLKTDNFVERPVQRVDQALVGQIAGVRVKQTSGIPGKGFSINIRGTGSISANNEPLYVIDGFPIETASQNSSGDFSNGNPLDNISPNDIASIEVLKDASAASIYGSRAANGVVLITTKTGIKGKARINFNTNIGWSKVSKKLDILNTEEWIERAVEMQNAKYLSGGAGRSVNDDAATREAKIGSFDASQIPDPRWFEPGYGTLMPLDWQDRIFRTGFLQNYALSATGGNDFVKYYISGDHQNNGGNAIGLNYKQYSARMNVEVQASNKIKFGLNINPSYSIANNPGIEGKDNIAMASVTLSPIDEESVGYYTNVFGNGNINPYITTVNSPVGLAESVKGETKRFRTLSTLFGEYRILKGLSLRSTLNLDHVDNQYEYFRPSSVSGTLVSRTTSPGLDASGNFQGYRSQNFVNENTLSYATVLNDMHNISVVAGTSYSSFSRLNWNISSNGGFNNDVVQTLNNARSIALTSNTNKTKNVLVSMFGRLQYSFSDKYLLSTSLRRDASSRFGKNSKWGVFPAASVGWRISKEKFMPEISGLNDLKIRASWGVSGNNGFGDFEDVASLGISNYSYGGSAAAGLVPSNVAKPDLGWEESEMVNIGVDLTLLSNRIEISYDYYVKNNTNLLLSIPIPLSTGFGEAATNIGEIQNKGWELEIAGKIITAGPLKWDASLNLSHLSNKVKKLGANNAPIYGGSFDITHNILTVGQPMYSIFVVQQIGILSKEDIENGVAMLNVEQEGDPKYLDADNDGVIGPSDRVLSGHPNPDYTWGFNTRVRYKKFDLGINVQGQWGGKVYSIFGRSQDRTGMDFLDNPLGFYRDRWRSAENPGAGKRGKAYSTFGRIKNTDWLYPNDYWRIRNITLGYDLGNQTRNKMIQGLRIYMALENYFGADKYLGGFNPEAVNNSGEDYGAFPLPKSFIVGLNVTF
ncbi:MAG: TonB-dependent receptor [Chitinophagaceae bacterium]|nr:TonB-dependent receptor [Chitinophagaceae bacterium]